jgi:hypothetical protein
MEYVEQNHAQCQGPGIYTMHGSWLPLLPLRIVLQGTEGDSAQGTRRRKENATTKEKTAKDK